MAKALRHVGIVVSSLKRALDLYQNYLGCKLISVDNGLESDYQSELVGIKNVVMNVAILRTNDNNRIELLEYKSHPGNKRTQVLSNDIGASHFALTVNNIDKLYTHRNDFKVCFISKPLISPDGFVKVAYAILMNECIVELVEVLNEKAKYTGADLAKKLEN